MSRKTLPLEPRINQMFKAAAEFARNRASPSSSPTKSKPFKNFYNQWFNTLKNSILPNLRRAMLSSSSPTILATQVDAVHHHFQAYYEELDLYSSSSNNNLNLPELLFPEWRNSLEKPFLWLGDLHPYLFTNLLRSFLEDEETRNQEDDDDQTVVDLPLFRENFLDHEQDLNQKKPWQGMSAWDSPSKSITIRVDQIECGLRLMVPSLVARARQAQSEFVERVGFEWRKHEGRNKEKVEAAVGEAMLSEMEELVNVFLDANRLRKSVLADILNATNVYQSAQFFEGLAQFLVGFHDQKLLREFEKQKVAFS